MRRTRIAALTAAASLAAAGTGVAVATSRGDEAKEREQAVLSDAAKRLDVTPDELRDALSEAQDAQLDADVKAGRLTQEQADAIKRRRAESGAVLGGGPGFGFHHRGGPGFFGHFRGPGRGPGDVLDAAADAIGISQDKLFEQLRDGKTLAEIVKANGKSMDDVKAAVRKAVKERLDEAVKNGPLTQEQADEMLDHLVDRLDDIGKLRFDRPPGPWGPPGP